MRNGDSDSERASQLANSPDGPPGGSPEGHTGNPPSSAPTGWRQTFSSLSDNRDFRNLFIGNIGFFFGMNMMIILRGWLVEDKWHNAAYLGYLMASVAVPLLLLSPVAGVVTDRVDRRKLLLVAQSALVVVNGIVGFLIITDVIAYWHLLIASSLTGAAFAFNMPGRQALVATLVPREKLMNAMALSTATMNASRIIGPTIAGVLVGPIGIGGAYMVTTGFYIAAVAVTFVLPPQPPQREKEFTFFEDLVGGFSYIRQSSVLVALILFATLPMIFAMPYVTLLPVFANRVWDVGSTGFGIMQAASGVGGLAGALVIANLDSYPKKTRLLLGGAIGFGTALAFFAISPSFYLGLFFIGLVGFGSMIFLTVNNTAIQLVIPEEMRGRVMSVMMMTFGLMPLGAVPAGVATQSYGVRPVVVIGAVASVAAVVILFSTLSAFRSLDHDLEQGKERAGGARRPGGGPRPVVPSAMPGASA